MQPLKSPIVTLLGKRCPPCYNWPRVKDNGRYGQDLIELFRGSGEEDDEKATVMLGSKLRGCDDSNQHCQQREAVEDAEQIAEQFLHLMQACDVIACYEVR